MYPSFCTEYIVKTGDRTNTFNLSFEGGWNCAFLMWLGLILSTFFTYNLKKVSFWWNQQWKKTKHKKNVISVHNFFFKTMLLNRTIPFLHSLPRPLSLNGICLKNKALVDTRDQDSYNRWFRRQHCAPGIKKTSFFYIKKSHFIVDGCTDKITSFISHVLIVFWPTT